MAENRSIREHLGAADVSATLNVEGFGGVAFQITGTFSGTLSFECSVDGVNFRALLVTPSNSTTQVTTATAAGVWTASVVGFTTARARMSSFSSGTALVAARTVSASPGGASGGGGGGGGTSSTFGDPFPAAGTAVGFIDNSGNMAGGTLDASGFLKVNVAAGSSGNAAASATGSAVPASADYQGVNVGGTLRGQTGVNPTGSVFAAQEDLASIGGSLPQLLDLDTGAGTANTFVVAMGLPASGGPVAGGTATNPIRTDPTGTTTQPTNVAQINGVTPLMGAGNTGTGSPRVTIATDQATLPTAETVPTTIYNGKKAVTTAGTRVTLASSQVVKSVTIKALAANTGTIYVGDGSVASTTGFQLAAGDSISLDIANLATVNLDASVSGEGVTYLAVA